MITQQAQIKVNLPLPLKEFLESKASKYGMPMGGYLRYLILKDVSEDEYPVFMASEKTEKAYQEAKKQEKEGKLTKIKDLDSFFGK